LLKMVRQNLETTRIKQNVEVLNLLDSQGRVLLRTRLPQTSGDLLSDKQIISLALSGGSSVGGTVILEKDGLETEGAGLVEQCVQNGGDARGMMLVTAAPILENGELIGIVQMGSLLNGATEEVDRIRDAVFEDETYKGKPLGTATIFMGDLRISTNVLDSLGEPAVGTRASPEVAERVLHEGASWTGRAWVVDTWYLAQYDPIRDPDGNIIGMLYVGELEQIYLDMRTQALVLLLTVVLAGMAFSFFVFYLITRGVLGPVEELAVATTRLADGDLAYRVPIRTGDEVGDLGRSFNKMAQHLEIHQLAIEQQRQALKTLNLELETTNRNYMEMLGFVTHELKNPLASATLSLHTVKDGYLGELNTAQKRSLESVASSLDYFYDMIKNYLDLSRLEKGELKVHKTSINLVPEVVEPILLGLAQGFREKEMGVENQIPSELKLRADRDLLRIVFDNLLSNAIKYGRQGGRVVLDLNESDNELIFGVCNEGESIPPEKVGLLFQKFSRLDGPEYAGKKGTGLGLFICKEIIDGHGGKIWVETADAGWTRFRFSLARRVHGTLDQFKGDSDEREH
jgi:two-component system NtrC family sensor kinase